MQAVVWLTGPVQGRARDRQPGARRRSL